MIRHGPLIFLYLPFFFDGLLIDEDFEFLDELQEPLSWMKDLNYFSTKPVMFIIVLFIHFKGNLVR